MLKLAQNAPCATMERAMIATPIRYWHWPGQFWKPHVNKALPGWLGYCCKHAFAQVEPLPGE
jgi:hypothetical protein